MKLNPCHLLPFETLVRAAERGMLRTIDSLHLTRCDGCREAVALLRRQTEALRQLAAPAGDTSLRERILDLARAEARERIVELLRALLREVSRPDAPDAPGAPGAEKDTPAATNASVGAVADLLFEVAVLDRRLSQLGGSPGLGDLADARPTTPDLARRTLTVLEQLQAAWPSTGASGDAHHPTATPSLRDSLAPR